MVHLVVKMAVITVSGEIPSEQLGITDIHEHILCDLTRNHESSGGVEADAKVELATLGIVTNNPSAIKDNLILDNVDLAIAELLEFGKAGGRTVVDVTTAEFGRNPGALRQIAEAAGINIITCTGHYVEAFQSSEVKRMSAEALQDEMLREIRVGIGESGVRAGVIGEIGTSERLYPEEAKVSKVALCHMDSDFIEASYFEDIFKTGANIEFDTFGENFCLHPNYGPSDLDRVKSLCSLLERGHLGQIMLGCDVCLKCRLHAYGGWGYDHLLSNVLPAMKRYGISAEEIQALIVGNPRRFLDF
jgi:phosphotriesterase-related protein